jgi:PAT family beta-lactamase induction signal transducer AmpG
LSPTTNIVPVLWLAALLALVFGDAGHRARRLPARTSCRRRTGLGNAVHVNAYRVAGLVPGSLSLILADLLPWSQVFWITAAFMMPGMVMILLVSEPAAPASQPENAARGRRRAVSTNSSAAPGARRAVGAGLHLPLQAGRLAVHRAGDAVLPRHGLHQDRHRPDRQARRVVASGDRRPARRAVDGALGINRALWLFGVVQLVSILGFAWLAWLGRRRDWSDQRLSLAR